MFRYVSPLILAIFCCYTVRLEAQNFRVQVAAFADSVPASYFKSRGISGVVAGVDDHGIYRYYFGSYPTRLEAEKAQKQLDANDFKNTVIIDLEEQRLLTDQSRCAYFKGGPVQVAESDTVRFGYFDPGKATLSDDGKTDLEFFLKKLKEKPASELRILGYSDATGAGKANLELATNRARVARNYLIDRGIDPARIRLRVYGESVSGGIEDPDEVERESEREELRKLFRCVVLYWKN
ncbi:MAG: OmpA family protein [Saprospiraceae bacterium]|jgi:outer membrane protein OmpA-like peptidoglycan-associated protein|nr:OmpA family protein [Saprospiraceae bacterium]